MVTLTSPYEWLAPGAVITYTPPARGPGLTVTEPWVVPVDANGQVASAVRSNNIAGRYTVTVTTAGLNTPLIFTLTNVPLSVRVARTGTGKGVVVSTPAGVVCAPLCAAGFDYGRMITFTATASTGSVFTGWVGDPEGAAYSAPDPATAAAYAALANAAPDAASDTLGPLSVSGAGNEPTNEPTNQPAGEPGAPGHAVAATAISSGAMSFSITASRLITATFAASQYQVDVSANPAAGGVASGAGTFAYGTPLTVTAAANAGYRFLYWSANGTPVTTTAPYSFTLKAARTLVANFTPLPTAVADTATIGRGRAITISVLANDLDPVAALAPSTGGLTVMTATAAAGGAVDVAPDRTSIIYTARADFVGADTFTYTAVDANESTAAATVTVIVTNEAPPPTPPAPPPPPGTEPPAPILYNQLYLPVLVR